MNNKIEHTSAGGVLFEPNKKLGYYIVNNEIYYNKNQAMLAGSKLPDVIGSRLGFDPVRWVFNEDTFIKFPWHVEPEVPLNELYRIRAQQLRDQYDYIRLELSGGADSTTVAYSFLLNGIRLDEVVFRYPEQGAKNASNNPMDTESRNHLSEWEFAAKPLLNWIKTNYPEVKITVHDFVDEIIKEKSNEENWIYKTRHYIHPGHVHKHTIDKTLADTGKRIAVVYGIDKPKICIKDGKFFIYFVDSQASNNHPEIGDYTNITNEFFYWSPDACELLAKQAHMIKNWFSMPLHHNMSHLLQWPNNDYSSRTFREQILRPIIYPDYDFNTFQTAKSTTAINAEMDTWFFTNFKDTDLYDTWVAGVEYLKTHLNQRYFIHYQGKISNLIQYQTPFYYIGDSTIPTANKPFQVDKQKIFNNLPTYLHCIQGRLSIY
jgi:hypothetical protein